MVRYQAMSLYNFFTPITLVNGRFLYTGYIVMMFSGPHATQAKDEQLLACEEENGRKVSTRKGVVYCMEALLLCLFNTAFQEQKCTFAQYRHALHRKSGTLVLCIQYKLRFCLLKYWLLKGYFRKWSKCLYRLFSQ